MRATTRTTTCLLQVSHSQRPRLRNFQTAFTQRLQSISRESQYLYRRCNPSSSSTRSLSTTTAPPPPPRSRSNPIIPAPTWSLQSLELSKTHTPISDQELSRLTKRAVIDLTALDSHTTKGTISKASLAQDLGNMMHMIQQVQSALPDKEMMEHLTDADIYDVPRGVTAAPVRRERDTSTFTDATVTTTSSSTTPNKAQLKRPMWWESLLKPKTTTVGAHSYFAVCTQRDDENKK
jgi:hypothetical protein